MPETLDIDIVRGDTFALTLIIEDDDGPLDLSANSYRAQVRLGPDGEDVWNMTVDMTDADEGTLTVGMSPTITASLTAGGVWDLEQTDDTDVVITLVGGDVDLLKDVSR